MPVPQSQNPGDEATLEENITIRLQGSTKTGSDIDLSLTGIGPRFSADQVMEDDTMLSCEYLVSMAETGYRVEYRVNWRIRVAVDAGKDVTNYEYRDVSISGSVLCSAGRPIILVRNGAKPLQLTITKEADGGAPDSKKPSN